LRRTELLVIGALVVAIVLAAVAGLQVAPDKSLRDPRRSTEVFGPNGASALAQALETLDVPVERLRRPLFGIGDSLAPGVWVALLDVQRPPTGAEVDELVSHVRNGGGLFLAGGNRVERCFGVRVERVGFESDSSLEIRGTDGAELPPVQYVLRRVDRAAGGERDGSGVRPADSGTCAAPEILASEPLLRTVEGRLVAWRLETAGGGRVIILADSRLVSNRAFRRTDAGPVVLGWLLGERPGRVVVDEYHQGFGVGASIFLAAWRWVRTVPAGWSVVQLVLAGLLALAAAAVRFGPTLKVVERRRRSSLEHVDALAAGLQRAAGADAAVGLVAAGLRRRLSRGARGRLRPDADLHSWLDSLALATRSAKAHRAIKRLGWLLHEHGGDERVLNAAIAVEDVWEALGQTNVSRRS
jgi:hypothetical protein